MKTLKEDTGTKRRTLGETLKMLTPREQIIVFGLFPIMLAVMFAVSDAVSSAVMPYILGFESAEQLRQALHTADDWALFIRFMATDMVLTAVAMVPMWFALKAAMMRFVPTLARLRSQSTTPTS